MAVFFFHFLLLLLFLSHASALLPEKKQTTEFQFLFSFCMPLCCGAAIVLPNYDSLFEIFVVLLCYFRKGKSKLLHIIYFGARTQHASCIYYIGIRSAHTHRDTHIDISLTIWAGFLHSGFCVRLLKMLYMLPIFVWIVSDPIILYEFKSTPNVILCISHRLVSFCAVASQHFFRCLSHFIP